LRGFAEDETTTQMPGDFKGPIPSEWPLHERQRRFEMGCIIQSPAIGLAELAARHALGQRSAGWWECDLADDRLTWTAGIYRIFGFQDGARVPRSDAVACYVEDSLVKMERLRSTAVSAGSAFLLDAQIRPADGDAHRWMRLMGTTVRGEDGVVTHLQGLIFQI
jgi:PAS domain-containing protein